MNPQRRPLVAAIKPRSPPARSAGVLLFPCNYGRCIATARPAPRNDPGRRLFKRQLRQPRWRPIVLDHRVCNVHGHGRTERRKLRAGRSLSGLNVLYCIVPSFRRFIPTIRHVIRRSRGCTKKATAPPSPSRARERNSRRRAHGGRGGAGGGKKFIRALRPADTLISRQLHAIRVVR